MIVIWVKLNRNPVCLNIAVAPCQAGDDFIRFTVIALDTKIDRLFIVCNLKGCSFSCFLTFLWFLLQESLVCRGSLSNFIIQHTVNFWGIRIDPDSSCALDRQRDLCTLSMDKNGIQRKTET